jgi:UPF0755 protein
MRIRSLAIVVALAISCGPGTTDEGPTVRVTISPGTPLGVVANELAELEVIGSARAFKLYARITGKQRAIQTGIYDIPFNSSNSTILRMLTSGAVATNRLVVPEGLMTREIADLMPGLGISSEDFNEAIKDSAILQSLDIPAPNLEGFLYPSTYEVPVGATAQDVVRQMVGEFRNQWLPEWDTRAVELGFSRFEVVTFASIIEGEVMYGTDRPLVSSVYHNRIARGMRLQADPTIIFALGTRRTLYERDYRFSSPYNTYLIDGLPPGPIGQPSAASIEAALFPEQTDLFFFVADTTGRHIFSRTLREHNGHVAQLRVIWARQRR